MEYVSVELAIVKQGRQMVSKLMSLNPVVTIFTFKVLLRTIFLKIFVQQCLLRKIVCMSIINNSILKSRVLNIKNFRIKTRLNSAY